MLAPTESVRSHIGFSWFVSDVKIERLELGEPAVDDTTRPLGRLQPGDGAVIGPQQELLEPQYMLELSR